MFSTQQQSVARAGDGFIARRLELFSSQLSTDPFCHITPYNI